MDIDQPRSFYTTPLPADRECITVEATGICVMHPRPQRFRRDRWRCWQMMYTLAGLGCGDVQGHQIQARPGTLWIMPPDRDHGYQAVESARRPWRYRWVEFSGQMVPALLKMHRLNRRPCVHECTSAQPYLTQLVAILQTRGNAGLHEATALLMQILAAMEQPGLDAAQPPGPGRLIDEAAKAFMNRNLSRPMNLTQISRHVGVCPHHLIRVFRRRNATSPMQYLRQLRVNKAKRLLHGPTLNISQVGQSVGYDVLPHFSRMFKRATGMSPREFRRSCSGLAEPIRNRSRLRCKALDVTSG